MDDLFRIPYDTIEGLSRYISQQRNKKEILETLDAAVEGLKLKVQLLETKLQTETRCMDDRTLDAAWAIKRGCAERRQLKELEQATRDAATKIRFNGLP